MSVHWKYWPFSCASLIHLTDKLRKHSEDRCIFLSEIYLSDKLPASLDFLKNLYANVCIIAVKSQSVTVPGQQNTAAAEAHLIQAILKRFSLVLVMQQRIFGEQNHFATYYVTLSLFLDYVVVQSIHPWTIVLYTPGIDVTDELTIHNTRTVRTGRKHSFFAEAISTCCSKANFSGRHQRFLSFRVFEINYVLLLVTFRCKTDFQVLR